MWLHYQGAWTKVRVIERAGNSVLVEMNGVTCVVHKDRLAEKPTKVLRAFEATPAQVRPTPLRPREEEDVVPMAPRHWRRRG